MAILVSRIAACPRPRRQHWHLTDAAGLPMYHSFYSRGARHAADPSGNAAVGKRFAGYAAKDNALRVAARRPPLAQWQIA